MTDRAEWGLWWRGDAVSTPGWCEGAGDDGPVTRAVCEAWLARATSPRKLYIVAQWSHGGPRDLVAEWWEVRYDLAEDRYRWPTTRHPTRAAAVLKYRLLRRQFGIDAARVSLLHVRRYRGPRG